MDSGAIVNIIDAGATQAWPAYVPYVASKAALASVTRGLAAAFAPRIRVNGVAPGTVLLPEDASDHEARVRAENRTALGRVGTPEDVAAAVLYLAAADYVTGEILRVDGGQHLRGRRA
jgi:pteridine reductase